MFRMGNDNLKDTWKQTGTGLGHAFRDLGKSIVKSVRVGMDKADEWAEGEDQTADETNENVVDGSAVITDAEPAPQKDR